MYKWLQKEGTEKNYWHALKNLLQRVYWHQCIPLFFPFFKSEYGFAAIN